MKKSNTPKRILECPRQDTARKAKSRFQEAQVWQPKMKNTISTIRTTSQG
jgi:hypothetical protein